MRAIRRPRSAPEESCRRFARQTPSEQEEEDVRIAGFYQNTGNYKAAYERAKDAITLLDGRS